MNFRIIAHLVRSDWQRFMRLIVSLWIVIVLTALPWLLHVPGSEPMPQVTSSGWSSGQEEISAVVWASGIISNLVGAGSVLITLLAVILAAQLGMQSAKQTVTPIRKRERLAARITSLTLFAILPLGGVIFLNLLLQGFAPGVAASAATSQSGLIGLLLLLVAAFAAWFPTVWHLLAAVAALFSAAGFARAILPDYIPRTSEHLFNFLLLPASPGMALFAVLGIVLLAVLNPVSRGRISAPLRVSTAVLTILAAAFLMDRLPPLIFASPMIAESKPEGLSRIQPRLLASEIQRDFHSDPRENEYRMVGTVQNDEVPGGHGVEWQATGGGWISQGGKRIGTEIRSPGGQDFRSPEMNAGYFVPPDETASDLVAEAALSGENRSLPAPVPRTIHQIELGKFTFSEPLLEDRDAELHVGLTGTVYRYEKVWEIPLTEEMVEKKTGNLTWRVRRDPSPTGRLRAEVQVDHPASGFSKDPLEVRWDASPFQHYRLYFHLPESGMNLRAGDSLMHEWGPMLAGAGWHRTIFGPRDENFILPEAADLRLIALRPVVVARIQADRVVSFRPGRTRDPGDFDRMYERLSEDSGHRSRWYFSERPDPLTCSRAEFAHWLRVVAKVYPGDTGSEHDLAAFAPRFAGLMAAVAHHESVAAALHLGTPESRKDEVIGKIDSIQNPDRLFETAWRRGWLDGVRGPALRQLQRDGLWNSNAVMALEDPSTYPTLISRFVSRPEPEMYEKLRLLPGIQVLLEESIGRAARETNSVLLRDPLLNSQYSTPYGMFLYAAKQGDAAALEAMIGLYPESGKPVQYGMFRDLGYVLSLPTFEGKSYAAIGDWLRAKSAASFRYDPLLRLWQTVP